MGLWDKVKKWAKKQLDKTKTTQRKPPRARQLNVSNTTYAHPNARDNTTGRNTNGRNTTGKSTTPTTYSPSQNNTKTNKPSYQTKKPSDNKPKTLYDQYLDKVHSKNNTQTKTKTSQDKPQKKPDLDWYAQYKERKRKREREEKEKKKREVEKAHKYVEDKKKREKQETKDRYKSYAKDNYKNSKNEYYGSDDWKKMQSEIAKSTKKDFYEVNRKAGYSDEEIKEYLATDEGKQTIAGYIKDNERLQREYTNGILKDEAKKQAKSKVKAENKAEEKAKIGDSIYQARSQGALKTKEDVIENQKQGAKAFTDAHKTKAGRVAMGAISRVTPMANDPNANGSRKVFTDEQVKQIEKARGSKSYKAGEIAGDLLTFAVPSMAGAKKADKVLKGAKSVKGAVANLGKRSAIETAYNTPINLMQATKDARDENGKFSGKQFLKEAGVNTAMDFALGGAMNGAGAVLNKNGAKKLIKLSAKVQSGQATEKEVKQFTKLKEAFKEKGKVASNYTANTDKVKTAIKDGEFAQAVDKDLPTVTPKTGEAVEPRSGEKPEWQKKREEKYAKSKRDRDVERIIKENEETNIPRKKARLEDKMNNGEALTKDEELFMEVYRGTDSSKTAKIKSEFNKKNVMTEEQMRVKAESENLEVKQDTLDRRHTQKLDELTRALDKVKGNNRLSPKEKKARISSLESQINALKERGYEPPVSKKEAKELIDLKAKESVGQATPADKARMAEIEQKANTVKDTPNDRVETPNDDVEMPTAKTEMPNEKAEMPTDKPEMPTAKAEEPTAQTVEPAVKEDTVPKKVLTDEQVQARKEAKVSTKDVSEMSTEELKAEKERLTSAIKWSDENTPEGVTSAHNKTRKERFDEIDSELEARGETVPKAKNEIPSEPTEFQKSDAYKAFIKANPSEKAKSFVEEADNLGVDIAEDLDNFTKNQSLFNEKGFDGAEGSKAYDDASEAMRNIYRKVGSARRNKQFKDNPSSIDENITSGKDWTANDVDDITKAEVNNAFDESGGVTTLVKDISTAINSGDLGNLKGSLKSEADKIAKGEVDDNIDDAINTFLKGDFAKDGQLQASRYDAIANKLAKDIEADPENGDAIAKLLKVTDHLANNAVVDGKVANAVRDISKSTPKGRVSLAQKTIDGINSRFSQRVGKTFELTDEEKVKLASTPNGEELDKVYEDIAVRIYNEIPATMTEKINEIRHLFMLGNFKTHERNFVGNGVFKMVRSVADNLEIFFQNKVFKNQIEKRGGNVGRVRVNKQEINENSELLESEFKNAYSKNSSRFNETMRPDGVTANKGLVGKAVKFNYDLLEIEDMRFYKPEFKKSYVQFVKAKGWDINALTESQKRLAREQATKDAEYATFRDSCKFSTWLTGKKEYLSQAKGSTPFATLGYRAGNMMLEGVIPFVKTPVNVFRRSVDFSPASIMRALPELASKDADTFMAGIKHMSTGLTGTGVFGLGYFLATRDLITVGGGQHSGDEYFDRELGYQDYSLTIGFGDNKKSWSIDWASPCQVSLFMGAVAKQSFEDLKSGIKDGEGIVNLSEDALDGLYAMTNPILDASFMSSTRDLMSSFTRKLESNSGERNTNVPTAIAEMFLADMPKNYVSSLVPQLVTQVTNVVDPYQRDTSSTARSGIVNTTESSARQIINKTPFRVFFNQPKLNRMGNDVKNEDSIGARFVNALFNPSNVKKITENKYDRELISIRNNMEDKESKDYQLFFINYTGKPNSTLDDGGRMSYNQRYEYSKASRKLQWDLTKEMVDSQRYEKYMTQGMKEEEVKDMHWYSLNAGNKTIGLDYAINNIIGANKEKKSSDEKRADGIYTRLMNIAGSSKAEQTKANKEFYKCYMDAEKLYLQGHSSRSDDAYYNKALVAYKNNSQLMLEAYDLDPEKCESMKAYWDDRLEKAGSKKEAEKVVAQELNTFTCGITSSLETSGFATDDMSKKQYQVIGAGMMFMNGDKQPEEVYRAYGYVYANAQAGAGICKYNTDGRYDYNNLAQMHSDLKDVASELGNKTVTDNAIKLYVQSKIDSGEIENQDEASCLYTILGGNVNKANPFGTTLDHLEWGTDPDETEGGHGRRGRGGRRRGGRRGSGGGGSGLPSWDDYKGKQYNPDVKTETPKKIADGSTYRTPRTAGSYGTSSRGYGSRTSSRASSVKIEEVTPMKSALTDAYRSRVRKRMINS